MREMGDERDEGLTEDTRLLGGKDPSGFTSGSSISCDRCSCTVVADSAPNLT